MLSDVLCDFFQVKNRDLSIAVLRKFITKRTEEHEAWLSKRRRKESQKKSEAGPSESVMEEAPPEAPQNGEKSNGEECGVVDEEKSPEDSSTTTEESAKINEVDNVKEELGENIEGCSGTGEPINVNGGRGVRELKPPRVLEVLLQLLVSLYSSPLMCSMTMVLICLLVM